MHSNSNDAALEELEGTLEKIRFTNDEETWAVADLALPAPPGRRFGPTVTVVGNLSSARPGEWLNLRGQWRRHKEHGRQFEIRETVPEAPVTPEGMQIYLANSKGIGATYAKRLVDHFGPDTFDIIDHEPDRLCEVEGIGKKRKDNIVEVWQASQAERRIELFLYSHGITPAYAARIRKSYGEQVIERIQNNPYGLARDIWGIGFKKADLVAMKMGIEGDDPRRVRAGLQQVLREAQSDGHLYLPTERLVERASEYLAVPEGAIRAGIEDLHRDNLLIHEPVSADDDPAGEGHLAAYRRPSWEAERACADDLQRLLSASAPTPGEHAQTIQDAEADMGITLAPQQRQAIAMAFDHNVAVITGGPGTGKTTLVKAICRLAEKRRWRIGLAAPTGRAARRLNEATGHDAATLHRMLEFSFKAGGFQRNHDNPVEFDLLVVDEASMIDIFLMRALAQAVPTGCHLVLVGDVDQLPSVGPGDVLADLIRAGTIPICRLATVFRQSQESGIVRNAHRINQGLFPERERPPKGQLADFYVIGCVDADDIRRRTLKVVTERIPKAFGLDPIQDIQVLAPMHRGSLGTKSLNEALQESLNPNMDDDLEARKGQHLFRVHDRVMQLRNNYDKEVFNGDVGTVTHVIPDLDNPERAAGIEVEMDGRAVLYEHEDLDELTLAYAITAHKSQGSEYPAVVIPLATAHYVLLERNLLYTALTRAKKLAILIVMDQALARAVKNVTARARYTRLALLLRDITVT